VGQFVAEPGIVLFDVELQSLGKASPQRAAAALAEMNVLPLEKASQRLMLAAPMTLVRFLAAETAEAAVKLFNASGGAASKNVSVTACRHCRSELQCKEGLPHEGGVRFYCWPCGEFTFFDSAARRFLPIVKCSCGAMHVWLPDAAAGAELVCACGAKLKFVVKKVSSGILPVITFLPRRQWVFRLGAPATLVLLISAAWVVLRFAPIFAPRPAPQAEEATPTTKAYQQFNAKTGRAEVIAALGPPERETESGDKQAQLLFYRRFDLFVVLRRREAGFFFDRVVRLSDEAVVHAAA
jgi:hypothetical protein